MRRAVGEKGLSLTAPKTRSRKASLVPAPPVRMIEKLTSFETSEVRPTAFDVDGVGAFDVGVVGVEEGGTAGAIRGWPSRCHRSAIRPKRAGRRLARFGGAQSCRA